MNTGNNLGTQNNSADPNAAQSVGTQATLTRQIMPGSINRGLISDREAFRRNIREHVLNQQEVGAANGGGLPRRASMQSEQSEVLSVMAMSANMNSEGDDDDQSNIEIFSDSLSEDHGRADMIEVRSNHSYKRTMGISSTQQRVRLKDLDERYWRLSKHFTCNLCKEILLDPVECTNCSTAFCKLCISSWHQKNPYKCPLLCSNKYKYVNMHRVVKKMLEKLRFHCPEDNCKYSRISMRDIMK